MGLKIEGRRLRTEDRVSRAEQSGGKLEMLSSLIVHFHAPIPHKVKSHASSTLPDNTTIVFNPPIAGAAPQISMTQIDRKQTNERGSVTLGLIALIKQLRMAAPICYSIF
jgi:hypothetical protein